MPISANVKRVGFQALGIADELQIGRASVRSVRRRPRTDAGTE